jgi:hypothetical protein
VASLPDLAGALPDHGAALLLSGDRATIVVDTPNNGRRLIEFSSDKVSGEVTGRVGIPTSAIEDTGEGLALVVDRDGHPVSAEDLSAALHEFQFDSASGWNFGSGFTEAHPESGAPTGVSVHQADWAREHGAGFASSVEHGPNAVYEAALKAAGGRLSGHGVEVTDPLQLRQVLGRHLLDKLADPDTTLRDFPSVHAAFVAEGADRIIGEFFGQDQTGANARALHQQLDEHIASGKADQYIAEAVAEPNRWEEIAQPIALDLIADWSGHGVLDVDHNGQVRLHGDSGAPQFAVGRLGSDDAAKSSSWVAFTHEHAEAEPYSDAAVHTASSLTARIPHTATDEDSFYHAVLDASGGAIQIDRDTLVNTPAGLKQQLPKLVLDRPDLLDTDTRESIERETGIGANEGLDKLLDALADPTSHTGEMVARHVIGSYLGKELSVEHDGARADYGSGHPIKIHSVVDDRGESRWEALPLESHNLEPDLGHDQQDSRAAVQAERVGQSQWTPQDYDLKAPDEIQQDDPWRSASFCATVMVDGVETRACVSVTMLTLDAALAAELGVAMR